MNFELTSEQAMLKESVERMIAEQYGQDVRRQALAMPAGWSEKSWRQFAELGLLGIGYPEEDGGFGGTGIDTMIVMEAFGRGAVVEPYLGSVILAGSILRHARFAGREGIIKGLVAGEKLPAFASEEQSARYRLDHVQTRAARSAARWQLDGRKVNVTAGDTADVLFLTARIHGAPTSRDGLAIFSVSPDLPGVTVEPYTGTDGTRLAAINLAGVTVGADALIAEGSEAWKLIELAHDEAIAALCAEAVGLMEAFINATVEHLKGRQQFGGPLARFQALQHRAAEMYVAKEQSRSMAIYAAVMMAESDRDARRRAISSAKVQIAKSIRFVGQQAVQLAGGIGVTDEYIVGQLFKRSSVVERQFGDADHHLALIDALQENRSYHVSA